MSRVTARRGFTLLELVVALAVTGLVTTAGYSAVALLSRDSRRADDAVRETAQAAAVRRTLAAWIAGARLTIEEDEVLFRGLDGELASDARAREPRADDELSFLTTAATGAEPGETLVRLFVDRDPRTAERGLVAALQPWRGWPVGMPTRVQLSAAAHGLEIAYLSGLAEERRWLPSWISGTVLPAAVSVTIVGDTLPALLARPLIVPLGSGS